VWLPGQGYPHWGRRRPGPRRPAGYRRPPDRRHYAHQSQYPGSVRPQHPGDCRYRARCRRPALLRRDQPQHHPGQGETRRHGLRRDPHQPPQDLLPPRRRSGYRSGGSVGAPGALSASTPGDLRRYRLCLAQRDGVSAHHRPPQGLRRQYGHPAAGLCLCPHAVPRVYSGWPNLPPSTPTISSST